LTFDKRLLAKKNNFKQYFLGGCWIDKKDWCIYKKTKLLSTIVSQKKATSAQRMRHDIIREFKSKIDVYGKIYNPIKYKLEGLKNYAFSIVTENCKKDYYFTEKLIDCFVTGTIPIYHGCSSIGNIFDKNGIIQFDDVAGLEKILEGINMDVYKSKLKSITNNYNRAMQYTTTENGLWEIFKGLV